MARVCLKVEVLGMATQRLGYCALSKPAEKDFGYVSTEGCDGEELCVAESCGPKLGGLCLPAGKCTDFRHESGSEDPALCSNGFVCCFHTLCARHSNPTEAGYCSELSECDTGVFEASWNEGGTGDAIMCNPLGPEIKCCLPKPTPKPAPKPAPKQNPVPKPAPKQTPATSANPGPSGVSPQPPGDQSPNPAPQPGQQPAQMPSSIGVPSPSDTQNSPTLDTSPNAMSKSSNSMGIIIGASVGGVCLLCCFVLLVVLIVMAMRRRSRDPEYLDIAYGSSFARSNRGQAVEMTPAPRVSDGSSPGFSSPSSEYSAVTPAGHYGNVNVAGGVQYESLAPTETGPYKSVADVSAPYDNLTQFSAEPRLDDGMVPYGDLSDDRFKKYQE